MPKFQHLHFTESYLIIGSTDPENARSPERYSPNIGPGCVFFDFDNDGWLDIFLVNSGQADFYTPSAPIKNALYRNNREGGFTDVTDKSGLAGGKYFGMGAAAGDYDGDGWHDLYVTAYGRTRCTKTTATTLPM